MEDKAFTEEKGAKLGPHSTGGIPEGREGEKVIGDRVYVLNQGLEAYESVMSLGEGLWSGVAGAWGVKTPD